ncbi:MAG: alpha/beta hydrolase [Deltaproteobacteria bacterium]|nr:alpha/beta hydrolase [Deltaproteobacteria bacterium]
MKTGIVMVLLSAALACDSSGADGPPIDSLPGNGPDGSPSPSPPSADAALPVQPVDFVAPGSREVSSQSGSVAIPGCTISYTLYQPASGAPDSLVVLGHGFSRGQSNMIGIAEHMASHGARVVTPDFCNVSDHGQNGVDAADLAEALAPGQPVVYAGHSAGGLSAVLAASQDSDAIAVLALDLTDADGQAVAAAESMTIPMFDLVGESGSCNSSGNGIAAFEGANAWAARLPGATHCDFEEPSGFLCTFACGSETGAVETVKALAAAFATWQLGLAPAGQDWASPSGDEWAALVADGVLKPL